MTTKITIDPVWLNVLRELDKHLLAKRHDGFLAIWRGLEQMQMDLSKMGNDQLHHMELTAIASTKDTESIQEAFSVSYEEDEDCDFTEIENRLLRGLGDNEIFTFEVEPLERNHPQVALQHGFIVAKTYEEAKAKLMSLKEKSIDSLNA